MINWITSVTKEEARKIQSENIRRFLKFHGDDFDEITEYHMGDTLIQTYHKYGRPFIILAFKGNKETMYYVDAFCSETIVQASLTTPERLVPGKDVPFPGNETTPPPPEPEHSFRPLV